MIVNNTRTIHCFIFYTRIRIIASVETIVDNQCARITMIILCILGTYNPSIFIHQSDSRKLKLIPQVQYPQTGLLVKLAL